MILVQVRLTCMPYTDVQGLCSHMRVCVCVFISERFKEGEWFTDYNYLSDYALILDVASKDETLLMSAELRLF